MWPSYPQPSSHVLLPPLPPPPLQLLSSASSDYLSTSTTLHQHTQTHSTRLVAVTTDTKRKIPLPLPATTLIKIETDATTLDQSKTLQAVSTIGSNTGTVYTDPNMTPLVTTHVIYQHPTNLILPQPPAGETPCRSQATSPVTYLTPPPETLPIVEEETSVQDASNQTDAHIYSEDDALPETPVDAKLKSDEELIEKPHVPEKPEDTEESSEEPEAPIDQPVEQSLPEGATVPESEQDSTVPQVAETATLKPDLSGLELLSNSIVEFENCRKSMEMSPVKEESEPKYTQCEMSKEILPIASKDAENEAVIVKKVDDNLGGLDLLCALAEQRILEEVNEKTQSQSKSKDRHLEREHRRKEKRKSKRHPDEPKHKKSKSERRLEEERERIRKASMEAELASVFGRVTKGTASDQKTEENFSKYDSDTPKCSCKENYRSFKTPESEEEVRKFIASKSQPICCKGEWPCMNAMELDMRMKLADLQRQYREKQLELSKLKPKKHSSDCSKKNRSRKKSTNSERSATPPPLLDKMDIPVKPNRDVPDLLKPPTLCAEAVKLPKVETTKQLDFFGESHKRYHSPDMSGDSSPEKWSSSKKRKVGRPKKILSSPGLHLTTETIVAKKPKKGNLVGYLLAAKEKLKMQCKNGFMYADSPPRYVEESTKKHKSHKHKNNNNIVIKSNLDDDENKSCKIRPKLKAEPMVKSYDEEGPESEEEEMEEDEENEEADDAIEDEENIPEEIEEDDEELAKSDEDVDEVEAKEEDAIEEEEPVETLKHVDSRCILTAEHLGIDKLRVLTAMGGLFYAGHLNAVEPPDVYSITLDGERGNRPHIMSREEILRDAVSIN